MSDEKDFDFDSLFGASFHPELRILVDVAKEQLAKDFPLEQVLLDSLEFAVANANNYHTDLICKANEQVANGLRELAYRDAWPNLMHAADHAIDLAIVNLKKDDRLEDIIALTKLRKKMLHTSISELKDIFKEDWLEENYPELTIEEV
jgi:hypothetical protein